MNKDWVYWNKGGRWQPNDEGYYMKYCYQCRKKSEHDNAGCCECHNRRLQKRR